MPSHELKAKYGRSLNTPSAINHAIRAELIGGGELLAAADVVSELLFKLDGRDQTPYLATVHHHYREGLEEASRTLGRMLRVYRAEIRRRYKMPPEGSDAVRR